MKKVLQRILAIACMLALAFAVLPATGLHAYLFQAPSFTVKAVNGTDVEVTIENHIADTYYEVWITSDYGYKGYRNEIKFSVGGVFYKYNDIPDGYIIAAKVARDRTPETTSTSVTIKNLPNARVSVMVRAHREQDYYDDVVFSKFSEAKTVKVTAQKKGYKSSYDFSKVKKGDTIKFGTYEQDFPLDGRDPIEWVVLDKTKDRMLVMSKYALDCLPYNTEDTYVTWENCTLRKWLNEEFYKTAFNKTEKAMIRKTKVRNTNTYSEYGSGNDTKDKVFLLSTEEVLKKSYGFDTDSSAQDINRRCAPSNYAVRQGATRYQRGDSRLTADSKGTCPWWLRSTIGYDASNVLTEGWVDTDGSSVASSDGFAVRPVMVLKLKS